MSQPDIDGPTPDDLPRVGAASIYERCGVRYPELAVQRRGGGSQMPVEIEPTIKLGSPRRSRAR
jgi:hypothetical protein